MSLLHHASSRRVVSAPSAARNAGGGAPFTERSLRAEVLRGLRATPKTLAPKLFYDDHGAELFEQICEQPEYYVTRAELEILRAHATEIARLAGPGVALVEYGSGAGTKVRLLLDALTAPAAYVPVDISREQLARVASAIQRDYPALHVRPVWADYTHRFPLPHLPARSERVAFFPGSTLGNFHPPEAANFLRSLRSVIGYDGALILGIDRRKDRGVLERAYDDGAGVTAAFNLNVLRRLNRDLGADFDLARFRHRALFNDDASRIEMHLESLDDQTVTIRGGPPARIAFARGETIWTESSYKYDRAMLDDLTASAGFEVVHRWTDANELFWVVFLRCQRRASDGP